MLVVQKRLWFRALAGFTAAVTLWFTLSAASPTNAGERPKLERIEAVAARLGIDADRVRGGDAFETREKAAIAAKRAAAVQRVRAMTAPKAEAVERAKVLRAAIERQHLPDLLAGAARAADELARTARERTRSGSKDDRKQLQRLGGEIDSLTKRVKGVAAGHATEAIARAQRLAQAAMSGASAAEVVRLAPEVRKPRQPKAKRPRLDEDATPPEPRRAARLGAVVPPELRSFYAEMLDAPGLEVESDFGLLDPPLLATGIAPAPRLASAESLPLGALLDLAGTALGPPGALDLAETPETRLTPEMRHLVARLGKDPIALYDFVHDETAPEPYYGSKKGSVGAFEERAGNDADLASLLVALLRAAGIPARFEYGTVDLLPAQAMAWTGTTDPGIAADILVSSGIPATKMMDGATVAAVRIEHVWARAYLPYSNYRGLPRAGSRSMWVRLDPTLKRAKVRSAVDLRGKVAFDYAGFLARPSGETPLAHLEAQFRSWVAQNGNPCKTLDEAIPAREIVPDGLTILPAEVPAPVVATLATFSSFPSSMRHSATIAVGAWSARLDLSAIYGSALTLAYKGARPSDQAAIDAVGAVSALDTPAAVSVVPALLADGVEMGRGEPVLPGTDQEWVITMSIPNGTLSSVRHAVAAGAVFAVGFDVGRVPDSVVARREADLAAAVASGAKGDALDAARGNRALWRYFWHADREQERIFGLEWMRLGRSVSEGAAGREIASDLLYGTPVRVKPGRYTIDIGRYSMRPYSVDGQNARRKEVALLAGYDASTREHLIWEEVLNSPAISTVRVLQAATSQGVQVLTVDSSNAAVVSGLPYSPSAVADITDKVHAGLVVKVPERPVTWGVYANAEGYVVQDPLSGAADFRLNGTLSGGQGDNGAPPDAKDCGCDGSPPAGSVVNVGGGDMSFSETDLTVPARGILVAFTRRYNSMSPYGGRLGPGWQHSYEVKLVPDPDGSFVFVNDSFRTERFKPNQDGSYTVEPGYHERLERLTGGGWRVVFKDGTEYRFRADGQLAAIQDPNDHLVLCRYDDAGKLAAVVDSLLRDALTFEYEVGGLLAAVVDLTGRRVEFGHVSGDLSSVKDVLGDVKSYTYDSAHRLASKTDRNGNRTDEFYDGEGRWIGGREPDGLGRSVAYDALNRRAVHVAKDGGATIYEYDEQGNLTANTDQVGNRRAMEWDAGRNKTAEVDARGNRAEMTYDADGNLLTRKDPLGNVTKYTPDARGHVLAITDAAGKQTVNVYDDRGNLKTTTDPTGATTSYGYTADGLPQTITQPGGATTTLDYFPDGKVKTIKDAEGGVTTLGYDTYGHLASIQDPLGGTRTLAPDPAGRIGSMTDASGATTSFEYDAQGNRTAVVDAANARTELRYDALNRLWKVIDTAGNASTTEYDPEGRVTARVDALGHRSEYHYDAAGRLVETVDALANASAQAYCADAGQACGLVDPLGNATVIELDPLGRPAKTTDANGGVSEEHYDALGRRDWSKDAAGRVTAYGYDLVGRLTSVTDALGSVTGYGYDARGNRASVTDANGKVTTFEYDRANRLRFERNPLGIATEYRYDAAGNRRYKIDGNGSTTEYQYDANRRLRKVLFADGTSYDFDYDARGNRTLEKSATHERGLSYDALGRLQTVEDRTLGRTLTYDYNPLGQRKRLHVDSGETVSYEWDAAGRLFSVTDPEGAVTRYRYDAAGRRSRVEYGNKTAAAWVSDAAGQVLSIVYANAAGEVLTAFGYGYDPAGNRTYKAFADGKKESYGYDALNRVTSVDYPSGRYVEYGYDPVGNRLGLVDSEKAGPVQYAATATASSAAWPASFATGPEKSTGWGWMPARTTSGPEWLEVTFTNAQRARSLKIRELYRAPFVGRVDLIDDQGQSHTVFEGGDSTANYGWLEVKLGTTPYKVTRARIWTVAAIVSGQAAEVIDAVKLEGVYGEAYAYNGFNQLTGRTASDGSSTTFGYDGNGNQTSRTDASGLTQYVYNQDNRLVGIALPSGVSNTFEYDANGLRTKKTDSSGTSSFLLDGLSVVAQYAPGGAKQAWYTQSLARIDEMISVANGTGKYWYEADALGSIYTLTTASGVVQARGGYDAFGAPVPEYGQAVGQPFGFTGREHELESGLVYARARYLQTGVGSLAAPDIDPGAISQSGGAATQTGLKAAFGGLVPFVSPGFGRYVYAESNPVLNRDPTGFALELVNRGSVIYTGFNAANPWWPGGAGGFGAVFGFFGQTGTFGGMSSALALTWGLAFHGSAKIGVSVGVEFGVYWGLVDACDYAGPFVSVGLDVGIFGGGFEGIGISPVFSVDKKALQSASSAMEVLATISGPVGFSLSASSPRLLKKVDLPFVGGSPLTALATYSELYQVWGCKCRT